MHLLIPITFTVTAVVLFLAGPVGAGPVETLDAFVESVRAEKYAPADNPQVTLSPFCPPEKADHYAEGIQALGLDLEGGDDEIGELVVRRGDFVGCLLVLRARDNLLGIRVRPICLLRTGGEWRVAPGLSHFENTHFGFEQARHDLAAEVTTTVRARAREVQREMLDRAMSALEAELVDRRKALENLDRERVIRKYLAWDREGDGVGKLACLHLPTKLPPERLGQLLAQVSEPRHMGGIEAHARRAGADGDGDHGAGPQKATITVFVDAKKKEDEFCHVVGLLNPKDPSDFYTVPFYMTESGENAWRIVPEMFEVTGLPSADSRLKEWYEENEWHFAGRLIEKLGARGGERGAEDPLRIHEAFLEAARQRDMSSALRYLELPPESSEITGDELLDNLGDFWQQVDAGEFGPPEARMLRQKAGEVASLAVIAVFRPHAAGGNFLLLERTEAVKNDGRWFIRLWDWDAPILPGDEKEAAIEAELAGLRKGARHQDPNLREEAALDFFANPWAGQVAAGSAANPLGVADFEATVEGLLTDLRRGHPKAVLDRCVSGPAHGPADRGELALGEVAEILREVSDGKQKDSWGVNQVAVSGAWAGAVLPMMQPEREDGQKPARMLLFTRQGDRWFWIPGMQLFREVNRGYKALNANMLRCWKGALQEPDREAISILQSTLEAGREGEDA